MIDSYKGECEFVLVHNDFGLHNILVDDGQLVALIDWEWAIAGPRGICFQSPACLNGEYATKYLEFLSEMGCEKPTDYTEREPMFECARLALHLSAYTRWFEGEERESEKKTFVNNLVKEAEQFLEVTKI